MREDYHVGKPTRDVSHPSHGIPVQNVAFLPIFDHVFYDFIQQTITNYLEILIDIVNRARFRETLDESDGTRRRTFSFIRFAIKSEREGVLILPDLNLCSHQYVSRQMNLPSVERENNHFDK